jgi:hypothetical protein
MQQEEECYKILMEPSNDENEEHRSCFVFVDIHSKKILLTKYNKPDMTFGLPECASKNNFPLIEAHLLADKVGISYNNGVKKRHLHCLDLKTPFVYYILTSPLSFEWKLNEGDVMASEEFLNELKLTRATKKLLEVMSIQTMVDYRISFSREFLKKNPEFL